MATPFSFEMVLTLPEGPNLPTKPIPFALSNTFKSRVEYELNLPAGGGTMPLDFGTLPQRGARLWQFCTIPCRVRLQCSFTSIRP